MVVGLALAAVQMGMALPTGFLFGVGYGTGVRIGYEQVYPLLFPKGARPTTTELAATMKGMNTVYDAIGGKDASRMGIAVGITNAGEILNNPDFQVLEKLESSSSGPTSSNLNRSRFGLDRDSPPPDSLSDEIDKFNKDTGAEKYSRYRTYSITQLNNIISSSTNQESIRIANAVLQEKLQSGGGTPTTPGNIIIPPPSPSQKVLSAAQDPVYLAWITQAGQLKAAIQTIVDTIKNTPPPHTSLINKKRGLRSQLMRMSRDYRHPNNHIRENALRLRQALSRGQYK